MSWDGSQVGISSVLEGRCFRDSEDYCTDLNITETELDIHNEFIILWFEGC